MVTNLVSGNMATLSFMNADGDYKDFMCSTEVELEISADTISKRTVGDGYFKKYAYSTLGYTVTLSGIMKFDSENWDWTEMINSQLNFNDLQFQVTYEDDGGNEKSFRGYALVETSNLSQTPTDFVKTAFTLLGNGSIMYFDGIVPCPSTIDSITIDGADSPDGTIDITYTYSGPLAIVNYQLDNGPVATATAGITITIPTLAIGSHTISLTPVCSNDYVGEATTQSFTITHAMTCDLTVDSITFSTGGPTINATVSFDSDPGDAGMKYSINGGAFITYFNMPLTNPAIITMGPLSIGEYTLSVVPVCSNGAEGTGLTENFSVSTGAAYSTINWSYSTSASANALSITKNGILVGTGTSTSASGSFSATTSDAVNAVLSSTTTNRAGKITVINVTTSTTIGSHSYSGIGSASFSFSPSAGNEYQINALAVASRQLIVGYGTSMSICSINLPVYIDASNTDITTGIAVYTDPQLTNILTGQTFISSSVGEIFHMSTAGHVLTSTGDSC